VPTDEALYKVDIDPPGLTVESVDISTFYGQDRVVWEKQGAINAAVVHGPGDADMITFDVSKPWFEPAAT
jgi:hypothetical protein